MDKAMPEILVVEDDLALSTGLIIRRSPRWRIG